MPHDRKGKEIKVGDTVVFVGKVTTVTPGSETCNVNVAAIHGKSNATILTNADALKIATPKDATKEQEEANVAEAARRGFES